MIEDVIRNTPGTGTEFRIIVEKKGALDEITVHAEYNPNLFSGLSDNQKKEALKKLEEETSKNMKVSVGVRVPVSIVEPGTFERTTLKAKRVIDKRKKS
jgi:phenylacetate-CoA ligase